MQRLKFFSSLSFLTIFALLFACGGEKTTEKEVLVEEPAPSISDWPQWRGPTGQGLSAESNLPAHWSSDSPNILWRAPLPGVGNSSPIVVRGKAIVTAAIKDSEQDEMRRLCLAYDFETGEELWRTLVVSTPREERHRMNTSAAPTSVSDGELVYVYFGSHIAALNLDDGAIVWQHLIEEEYAKFSRYAASSSPVLVDDLLVIVQDQEHADTDDVGWMAAFDRKTGESVWRTEWDETCCSYSTPLIVEHEGETRFFFAHSAFVSEYDPSTGDELWRHPVQILQMVSSLTFEGDLLCVAGGAHNVRGVSCLRLSGNGAQTQVEELWATPQSAPETASPVLKDGLLYTVTSKGIISAFDAETGRRAWRHRIDGGAFHVSMVAGDGKLYIPNARGLIVVMSLGDRAEVIAENRLDEGGNASPALIDGSLLVRTRSQLVRIGKEQEQTLPQTAE